MVATFGRPSPKGNEIRKNASKKVPAGSLFVHRPGSAGGRSRPVTAGKAYSGELDLSETPVEPSVATAGALAEQKKLVVSYSEALRRRDARGICCTERGHPAPANGMVAEAAIGRSGHGVRPAPRAPGGGRPSSPIGTFSRPCFSPCRPHRGSGVGRSGTSSNRLGDARHDRRPWPPSRRLATGTARTAAHASAEPDAACASAPARTNVATEDHAKAFRVCGAYGPLLMTATGRSPMRAHGGGFGGLAGSPFELADDRPNHNQATKDHLPRRRLIARAFRRRFTRQ